MFVSVVGYTISHYRSTQRCAAIFPVGGMKHSQDDPRRSSRPPDGGRDDLLGEVMRKKRHRPDPSGSKQDLSRLAGTGGSVLRIGIKQDGSAVMAPKAWKEMSVKSYGMYHPG